MSNIESELIKTVCNRDEKTDDEVEEEKEQMSKGPQLKSAFLICWSIKIKFLRVKIFTKQCLQNHRNIKFNSLSSSSKLHYHCSEKKKRQKLKYMHSCRSII